MGETPKTAPAMATAQPADVAHPASTQQAAQQAEARKPPPSYAAYQTAPPYAAHAPGTPPPKGSKYAAIGTGGFIGMMILFAIPVVGWLCCIIMAFAAGNRNRRSFARATLVFLIIGAVLAVALYFLFQWVWEVVRENIRQYVNEATGGQVTDFDGLNEFFDILRGPDGISIVK